MAFRVTATVDAAAIGPVFQRNQYGRAVPLTMHLVGIDFSRTGDDFAGASALPAFEIISFVVILTF
ncbi:hypothetical protein, partial [Undibacterium sp.]|uniref:hypothetical protein n=1 Tax=Undibacterium sp. TaxID=1914977 RepID=UPI00374D47BF